MAALLAAASSPPPSSAAASTTNTTNTTNTTSTTNTTNASCGPFLPDAADRCAAQLLADGSAFRLVAVLNHGAARRKGPQLGGGGGGGGARRQELIVAQRSVPAALNMKLGEAQALCGEPLGGDYVCVAGSQFLITTVKEHSYYGRSTNTADGGGIIVIRSPRTVLVASYSGNALPQEVIPKAERLARLIP